ncbi:MAG TPA: CRTAC1 family protein [Gemmatimonadaceae bacterium]|nr:CRTAC1 family protein [Gemmatimonadaceae bacterium]
MRTASPQRWLAACFLSAALGCAAAESHKAERATRARTGTQRMADTLAVINAQGMANPEGNIFLNRERADELQALIAGLSGTEALNKRHWMAEERLKAGQTREAIDELQKLLKDAGVSRDTITPQLKPVFDLLAIAYLRLGEQENCLTNPAANVCIFPLKGAARHKLQEGARGAIARYTQLLEQYPDDRSSQWLLNMAYLAIGGYPDSIPKHYLVPNLAPRANDSFPLFQNIASQVGLAVTQLAGGLSVDDFNGDGYLDLFITSWDITQPIHLFLADGHGGYVDHTAKAGLDGIVGGLNTVDADYDNDGDVDILVLRGAWLGEAGKYPKSLLRNRGDGTFEDVTFESGLLSFHPSQTAAWADFNLDGYVDLFIGNESYANSLGGPSHRSELWLNNRNGTFTEVAAKVGINLDEFVKGVVWGDVNNDGLPDLFASVLYGRNKLFMNRGGTSIDTWRFEETSAAAGVELPITSFPTWFWDFDQDGWEDLLVLSYDVNSPLAEMAAREYLRLPLETVQQGKKIAVESSHLYKNNGDGTFSDVTQRVGLADKVIYAMGSNFGDLDNDGWLDFYIGTGNPDLRSVIPNRMFHSVGGKRFDEVTLPGGFGHIQKGHATAFADFDRDGDQDIYMVLGGAYQGDRATSVLFENPGWAANKWIKLELEGRTANRSAIGARVAVDVVDASGATRTVRRTVNTGGSFGAGSLQLHIGLGRATRIEEVRIQWPDSARRKTTYSDLALNSAYHVRQGDKPAQLQQAPVPFLKKALGTPGAAGEHNHN